jgi:plasmid stabilization system protein ParE
MRLFVRPEAEADLRDAYQWYEDRRDGLGTEFVASVESTVLAILENPTRFPIVRHDVRRALVRRFPFRVFLVAEPDEVVVLAILHAARHPDAWHRH